MNKNKLFKMGTLFSMALLASISLVGVGNSMARYISKGGTSDSAHAAEFGIDVDVTSMFGAFNDEYLSDDDSAYATFSVDSFDEENVIAPGTSGKAFEVEVAGKAEVATRLELCLDQISMITLKAGRYQNYTTSNQYDLFDLENNYNPVKWTLIDNKSNNELISGNLETIKEYFNSEVNGEIGAGQTINIDYTLKWQWPFTDDSITVKDAADTYIGKHASSSGNESFNFTATVTQID